MNCSEFKGFVMIEWRKQRDLLIEEALAFAQAIAANAPTAVVREHPSDSEQSIASSAGRTFAIAEPVPTNTPEGERIVIQRRLANFKAHQERFEREREEYFQKTLAKARANQRTQPTKIA
jgi:hypothetical protein